MDFSPDENQRAITELAADVLRGELDPERAPGAAGYDEQAWRALAKADLLSLTLPEDLGGAGLGVNAAAAMLTEIGRCAANVPALATIALGVLPLGVLGTAEQRADLLPKAAAGDAVLTAALHEPSAPWATEPATTATARDGGWVLNGLKTAVPWAAAATRVLVPATTPDGVRVFLVDPSASGVESHPSPNSGAGAEYAVRLRDVAVAADSVLPTVDDVAPVRVLHRFAVLGACAIADGALAAALELTTSHLSTREQFGRPLASFQAVAQQTADVYIASRTVHLAATSAAWRLDEGLDADSDLAVAGYWLTEQGPLALANCHHLHGGVGADETYPLHRYYSLIKDLDHFLGGAGPQLARLATTLEEA